MMKKDKKKIIVEGISDKIFIEELLKFMGIKNRFDVTASSGSGRKCEITNKKRIKTLVDDALDDGYKEVVILIDKETQLQCGVKYECLVELKEEYRKLMGLPLNVKIIVVDREIECWYLLWVENLKSYYSRCIKNAFEVYKIRQNSKPLLAQRAVRDIEKILKNRHKNRSFIYFLNSL